MDWNLLGHDWAVDLLTQQIIKKQVRHAYLFTGPEGVGRQKLATRLAQALNCPNPPQPGLPCLTCPTCKKIETMQYPDFVIIQPEAGSRMIRVEQIRDLQHNLALAPYEAHYKIALLKNFQNAHTSVPNALLKTLEEPPSKVIIILTADDPENLLPTIISRCETIRLRPLPIEIISEVLLKQPGIPAESAKLLAHISGGLPLIAARMNEQPELLEQRSQWIENFLHLLTMNRYEKFQFSVEGAKGDRDLLLAEMQSWISFWRDVVHNAAGSSVPIVNVDYRKQVGRLANLVMFDKASARLLLFEKMLERMEQSNINMQLALDNLLLGFPHIDAMK